MRYSLKRDSGGSDGHGSGNPFRSDRNGVSGFE